MPLRLSVLTVVELAASRIHFHSRITFSNSRSNRALSFSQPTKLAVTRLLISANRTLEAPGCGKKESKKHFELIVIATSKRHADFNHPAAADRDQVLPPPQALTCWSSRSQLSLRSNLWLMSQQLLYRAHENSFNRRRHVGSRRAGFVAALFVCDGGADVPRRVIAIRRHRHKQIRPLGLGGELIFYEQFSWRVQDAPTGKLEARDIVAVPRLTAPQPSQFGRATLPREHRYPNLGL